MNEPEGTPDQDLADCPRGMVGDPGLTLGDLTKHGRDHNCLITVLLLAYEQNHIDKSYDELDAEIQDLVQSALRVPFETALKEQPKRVHEIVFKRALRIVKPETTDPEAKLEELSVVLMNAVQLKSVELVPQYRTTMTEVANELIEVVVGIRLGKMSY